MGSGHMVFDAASTLGTADCASGPTAAVCAGSTGHLGASEACSGCGSGIFLLPLVRSNHAMCLVPPFRANLLYHPPILLSKHKPRIQPWKAVKTTKFVQRSGETVERDRCSACLTTGGLTVQYTLFRLPADYGISLSPVRSRFRCH